MDGKSTVTLPCDDRKERSTFFVKCVAEKRNGVTRKGGQGTVRRYTEEKRMAEIAIRFSCLFGAVLCKKPQYAVRRQKNAVFLGNFPCRKGVVPRGKLWYNHGN